MTEAEKLAAFIERSRYGDLSEAARTQLKIRVLDALGCAIGAVGVATAGNLRDHIEELDEGGKCALIGGGQAAPDRAAFFNTALVRYLDFNDCYLAQNESCNPSDNLGSVLAACEYANGSGEDLLTALALSYQVQCRFSDVAPATTKERDHPTQGAYAIAAGVSKALGLDQSRTANALGICETAFPVLRVTRTGERSNGRGLAYANTAFGCTHAAFLARRGITGLREDFEGKKGLMDSVAGSIEIDWSQEDLERVNLTIIKKYKAAAYAQSAIEAAMELKQRHGLTGREIDRADLDIFDVAYDTAGSGEEGENPVVRTKEEADHSLRYLIAIALLDGCVMPAQFLPKRIQAADVQALLQKVHVRPSAEFSRSFPREVRCRLTVELDGDGTLSLEKLDYEGFTSRPASWDAVFQKFQTLSEPYATGAQQEQIGEAVANLESIPIRELTSLLRQVRDLDGQEEGAA